MHTISLILSHTPSTTQCAIYELIEKIPKIFLKNVPAPSLVPQSDSSTKPVTDDCHISSETDLSTIIGSGGRTSSAGGSVEVVEEVEKESAVDCAKLSLQLPVESGSRVKPKSDVSTGVGVERTPFTMVVCLCGSCYCCVASPSHSPASHMHTVVLLAFILIHIH